MKLSHPSKVVVIGALLLSVCLATATAASKESASKGLDKKTQDETLKKLNSFKNPFVTVATTINVLAGSSSNQYNYLNAFNKVLINLGPSLMVFGMVLSLLSAHAPQKEPKEVSEIREKFTGVMNSISRVDSRISELESLITLETTKVSYGEYQRTIQNLYEDWQHAVNSDNAKEEQLNRAFFMQQFEMHYKHAATNLWKAMTGQFDGELNNDLLNTAKNRYKCDLMKLRKLCVSVTQTINQGLAVEGAYFGYTQLTDRAQKGEAIWKEKYEQLANSCEAVLKECRSNWKTYALPVIEENFQQHKSADNSILADKTYKALTASFSHRSWFVLTYNEPKSMDDHAHIVAGANKKVDVITKWKEAGKMLSVISFDKDDFPEFGSFEELMERMDAFHTDIVKCKTMRKPNTSILASNELLKAVQTSDFPKTLVQYVAKNSLNVAIRGERRRYVHTILTDPDNCQRKNRFNFTVILMG